MAATESVPLGAFVVDAVFLGEAASFALGDGALARLDDSGITRIPVHSGTILATAVTADGKAILTGGDDGVVALTDAAGSVTRAAERPRKWIDHVAAGPNGALAFGVGRQAVVRLADGRERGLDLPRAIGGLTFAPRGLRLAIARYDGVTLWWAGTEAEPSRLEWKGAHLGIVFSPDGRYVVTTMQDNALHGWRLDDGKDMRMSGYPAKPRSLSWSAKGRFLATSGANAAVLWPFHGKDGPMGKAPLQIGAREVLVTRVAGHPRADRVAIGYRDGMVMVVDIDGTSETLVRRPGDGAVSALAWDRAGRRLAFGTEEGAAGVAFP